MGLLLVNALVIGCNSCGNGKGKKGDGKKGEKNDLVAAFSKEHSLTPDQTEALKKYSQIDPNQVGTGGMKIIDQRLLSLDNSKKKLNDSAYLPTANIYLGKLVPGFQAKDKATAEKIFTQLIEMLESIKKNKGDK